MRSLSESSPLRFLTFGALYFAQGVPWGFIGVAYVVLMADQGLDNTAIGTATGLAYLPWSFKVLWGPMIDRFPSVRLGRRRPYIIVAQLLMGATMLLLALIGDLKSQIGLVGWILFVHNIFAALQDVAVDALAVDVLQAQERGRANSVMWAAKSAGISAGGGGGVFIAKHAGWPTLMIGMAVVIWIIMLVPLFLREHASGASDAPAPSRMNWPELKRSFAFSAPVMGVAIAFFAPLGFALVTFFLTRMYRVELHFSEEQIGSLTGFIEPIVGVFASFLGGYLADKITARTTMAVGMFGMAVTIAILGITRSMWSDFHFVVGWAIAFYTCMYVYTASSLGFFMTLSNPTIGATQFTIFMATTNLCYAAAARLGGMAADHFGYESAILMGAVVQLVTIALLPLCKVTDAEQRFRAPAEPILHEALGPVPDPGV